MNRKTFRQIGEVARHIVARQRWPGAFEPLQERVGPYEKEDGGKDEERDEGAIVDHAANHFGKVAVER